MGVFRRPMAVRMAEALAPFKLMFLRGAVSAGKQPGDDPDRRASRPSRSRPVSADTPAGTSESCSSRGQSRVVQPDIVQTGGIFEARKIAAMAEMHFVSVAPHNPWSWVNTVASLHLDAVIAQFPDPGGRHRTRTVAGRRGHRSAATRGRRLLRRARGDPGLGSRSIWRRQSAFRRSKDVRPHSGTKTARLRIGRVE